MLDGSLLGDGTTGVHLTSGNTLDGIGSDGRSAIGNGTGVLLSGAPDNGFHWNVISGNIGTGVYVTGSSATGNLIESNLVGTNASGQYDHGNANTGIRVSAGIGVVIVGNSISGNDNTNLQVDATASHTLIERNWIGTDGTGNATPEYPSGDSGFGLTIVGHHNVVKAADGLVRSKS